MMCPVLVWCGGVVFGCWVLVCCLGGVGWCGVLGSAESAASQEVGAVRGLQTAAVLLRGCSVPPRGGRSRYSRFHPSAGRRSRGIRPAWLATWFSRAAGCTGRFARYCPGSRSVRGCSEKTKSRFLLRTGINAWPDCAAGTVKRRLNSARYCSRKNSFAPITLWIPCTRWGSRSCQGSVRSFNRTYRVLPTSEQASIARVSAVC